MAFDIKRAKTTRGVMRTSLTKLLNGLEALLADPVPNLHEIHGKFVVLQETKLKLDDLDAIIFKNLCDTDASQDVLESELENTDEYKIKFYVLKQRIDAIEQRAPSPPISEASINKRFIKLPTLKIQKFSGKLLGWLPFWSQFKEIYADDSLTDTAKFIYLLDSIEKGTEAYDVVASYPVTEANFEKALDALKKRYGDNDLLLQVYVRELLGLVISNVSSRDKLPLGELYNKLQSHLRNLNELNLEKADPATWLYPLVESSLPEDILLTWQRSQDSKRDESRETPQCTRIDYLMNFLETEVGIQQRMQLARQSFTGFSKKIMSDKHFDGNKDKQKRFLSKYSREIPTVSGLQNIELTCVFCNKSNHNSKNCFKSMRMALEDKEKILRDKKLCYACLQGGHTRSKCKATLKCTMCYGKHWAIMCPDRQGRQQANQSDSSWRDTRDQTNREKFQNNSNGSTQGDPRSTEPKTLDNVASCSNQVCTDRVMLQTLMLKVKYNGKKQRVRAFLDPGSQNSYIKTSTTAHLQLPIISKECSRHSVFGGQQTEPMYHNLHKAFISDLNETWEMKVLLKSQSTICSSIPRLPRNHPVTRILHNKGIELTDIGDGHPPIELLIGADYWGKMLVGNPVSVGFGLTAVQMKPGWVLTGEKEKRDIEDNVNMMVLTMTQMETSVQRLWELDSLGIHDPVEQKTVEEKTSQVKNDFMTKIQRKPDGRYQVPLPWREGHPDLPTNREVAFKRMKMIQSKLKERGMLKEYSELFQEWEQEGFIERVEDGDLERLKNDDHPIHYLPHRPVFKDSPTTPVRPVFDASCKVGRNVSLNECLETGVNYIKMVPELLLRFREKKFGVISDIRKAFQMIEVAQRDRDVMRFLWLDEEGNTIEFRHARVMFGATCSPFILGAVLEFHLTHTKPEDKMTADQLLESLYVDNCVTSSSTLKAYESFKENATRILSDAQMDLRMWMSNGDVIIEDDVVTPVLGVQWDRKHDELFINIKLTEDKEVVTKRNILSTIARVFDPIGLLTPALLPVKLILQRAWISGMKWDQPLPTGEKQDFLSLEKELSVLEDLRIPRMMTSDVSDRDKWSVHLFTDASKDAYAAVIYLRVESASGTKVQLMLAKSRLAPIKKEGKKELTIPRMELMACLIGSRLLETVRKAIDIEDVNEYCWSDSSTVITWIQKENPWTTFVGNRVKEIRNSTNPSNWRHVPGKLNPADLPSRGCTPSQLLELKWWEGPEWLKKPQDVWPSRPLEIKEEEIRQELRKTVQVEIVAIDLSTMQCDYTFSSLVRIMGWLWRFINNTRKKEVMTERNALLLTPEEIQQATRKLIKSIQQQDMVKVNQKKDGLKTIIDQDGILHVETRLTYREDLPGFKYPMLLPRDNPVTKKLILECHLKHHHAGVNFLMTHLRENFWIPQARRTIRSVLNKCIRCYRYKTKSITVEEAPLPLDRIKDTEVFDIVGVDAAGPLFLKGGKKSWIMLYTCTVYRAIHLDLVMSLSTQDFVKSLERFVQRYHRPAVIYSDNGTNFRGADNLFQKLDWDNIKNETKLRPIKWKFNPASAAWWGGMWERLVRSVKELLRRSLSKASLSRQELQLVLQEVQEVINGRPLTYVSDSREELQPLTPKMFLNPAALLPNEFPEGEVVDAQKCRKRYQYILRLKSELRERFRSEYLGQIKARCGEKSGGDLKVGDIVLIGSDKAKRADWPLGRVVELYQGKDGKSRVALVQSKFGKIIRPVQRLYNLEMDKHIATELKTIRSGKVIKPPMRL